MKRKIVSIDEEKCNGCGECIPRCAESAIKIIDGKAKLLDDKFCDGLGACLGHCPRDAIRIIKRDAQEFDEEAVKIHLNVMAEKPERVHTGKTLHKTEELFKCPGSMAIDFISQPTSKPQASLKQESQLRHWPVQLALISPKASYFKDADLLVAADCVPFAYPNFHPDFLAGKSLVIGCPKLDDANSYIDKLTELITAGNIKSITLVNMEVPCCFGLQRIVEEAVKKSGKVLPIGQTVITIKGEKQKIKHAINCNQSAISGNTSLAAGNTT